MRSSRLPQLLRGTSSALVATFVALLAHVSAGGALPGLIGLVVPLVLSSMISVLLAAGGSHRHGCSSPSRPASSSSTSCSSWVRSRRPAG